MSRLWRRNRFPFFFALVPPVWADYYIDDTNTTLTYSSGPKAAWGPFAVGAETLKLLLPNGTYQVIDAFVCYNHTYRYAACFDTDSCLLTIPFTGSGITFYVNQAGPVGINASITVDDAHAQTNVLNAPPAPAYQIANVSMFDLQQLPSGPHTFKLLVNDLFGSYSGMMFDYAYVNESLVVSTATTTTTSASTTVTSTAASTSTPTQPPAHHSDIGAIVGSVVGVVAVIMLGLLAFFWIRRRRSHPPEIVDLRSNDASAPLSLQNRYDPVSTDNGGTYDPYLGSGPQRPGNNPLRSTELGSLVPLAPNRLASSDLRRPDTPSAPSGDRDLVTPFTGTSGASNSSGARSKGQSQLVLSNDTTSVPVSQPQTRHSPSDSRRETTPLLTDEQADFINSLHHNNVPAAAIARVVERMLADRHAGIREWERETRLARTASISTAPPSYDLVAERGE